MDPVEQFPVQRHHGRGPAKTPKAVYMAAYEVYCHVYAPQEALIEGDCRGGFSKGELIAFLYARSFPKDEWRVRVRQAFIGAENL